MPLLVDSVVSRDTSTNNFPLDDSTAHDHDPLVVLYTDRISTGLQDPLIPRIPCGHLKKSIRHQAAVARPWNKTPSSV